MSFRVTEWPLDPARSVFTATVTFESGEAFHGTSATGYREAVEMVVRAVEEAGGPAELKRKWSRQ